MNIKNFISTVNLRVNFTDSVENTIMKFLRDKYENKCFKEHYITKISHIVRRGYLESSKIEFLGELQCNVEFAAECKEITTGGLIVATITKLDTNTLTIASTKEFEIAARVSSFQIKPAIGQRIIFYISKVEYPAGSIAIIKGIPYYPQNRSQVFKVVVTSEVIDAMETCKSALSKVLSEVKEHKYASKLKVFRESHKTVFDRYSIYDLDKFPSEKYKDQTVLFIISHANAVGSGLFYIAPENTTPKMLGEHRMFLDGISAERKYFDYCTTTINFLECVRDLINDDQELAKSKEVLDIYN